MASHDLVVTRVDDLEAAVAVIRRLGRRQPFNPSVQNPRFDAAEVRGVLGTLPCRFPALHLWPSLHELYEAWREGCIEFAFEPAVDPRR